MTSITGETAFLIVWITIWCAVYVFFAISVCLVFKKAGQPWWGALVPAYNLVLLARMAGKPAWWAALIFLPIFGLFPLVRIISEIAKRFGKGDGFAAGLLFLYPVFWPILAFGRAQYNQPVRGFAVLFKTDATAAVNEEPE